MKKEQLQLSFNFDTSVSVLPSSVVHFLDKAKKFDLKVLLFTASADKYREGDFISKLSEDLHAEKKDVENSVAFWRGTGILNVDSVEDYTSDTDEAAVAQEASAAEIADAEEESQSGVPRRVKVSDLPQYTSAELNSLLEKHKNCLDLIDECQRILGKLFLASDIKVLMALLDYLALTPDYILVLMHYCARHEIKSMRTVEKLAISCLDDGYLEAGVLERALYARDEKEDIEYKIKNVFGVTERKLTSKEKKHLETWITTYKFDLDVIEKAYEITVNSTTKPSMHYANAILEKWYAEGVRNIEGVNALLSARELEKEKEGSSFDVDEFFNAALKRSYSDKV
ncbi:MAG: DnaD domain protein [Eubacteriales bacterium]